MKFLVVLALCLATAAALELGIDRLVHRDLVVPPIEAPEGRITNGQTAGVGQFPYQVGLSLRVSLLSSGWCGGSLIGNSWVLTAAHCTDGIQSATVYLGATVRTSAEVTYTVDKSNIIIHAGWNPKTLLNDISVIRIPAVSYTTNIQSVRLPNIGNTYSTYTAETVIASGWGRTTDNSNAVATNLQWAVFQVITNTACARTYGSVVSASNICVATPNAVSTCQGDSGGPLVLESSKVQIGLTSFGAAAGCEKGYPVAFTRLTSFLTWIRDNTGISY